ncbi:Transmembrane protein 184 [Actinidia chinensis var. chinensis]|uniref:Transmembrane protein 184 n=1 Tax=Actinidia chinensis var. chinensis TaxID=1590841 RepID=A0A2R6PWS3_ACTCC|nr:Transmembrane protein 184 [Actinidia chinensis var. chinensis]
MELKPSILALFLLFILLAMPCFSKGGFEVADMDLEIYEIDYRGPETHSYRPPPHRSTHKLSVHQDGTMTHRKFKGLRAGNGESGKKIHG